MLEILMYCALIVVAWPLLSLVFIIPIMIFRAIKFGLMLIGLVSPEDC